METLLVHQLLTAFVSEDERNTVLVEYDLDYLADKMLCLELEWTED